MADHKDSFLTTVSRFCSMTEFQLRNPHLEERQRLALLEQTKADLLREFELYVEKVRGTGEN